MSYNGAGVWTANSTGQPVVAGTTIDATVFNTLTADIATGLSTAMTRDGQTVVTANIPMGTYKLTGLGIGSASTDSARMDNANSYAPCEFRLTLTTAVPVTTADVTAAETLYCCPYKGARIALYDGTNWVIRTSAEMSIDVPDATNMYDVFCYDNSGTPTLELTAWTNTTTRATALTTQNGVLVKTGVLTRRYLGSFYSTTAGNGQIEDSIANRYLWNYYNRVLRLMRVLEVTDSWNYTTATIRQANGSSANQLNFCIGWSEDLVSAFVSVTAINTGSTTVTAGIGLDATNAFTSGCLIANATASSTNVATLHSSFKTAPVVGLHYLSWNEYSGASGTTAWYGDNANQTIYQSGIHGELWG